MALKLITPLVVKDDVTITVPGAEQVGVLKVVYAYQTARQHDAWRDGVVSAAASGSQTMTELLAPVIKGWEGLEDDQGQPIPYSSEALDDLLDKFPAAAGELYRGYTHVLTRSRAKN